MYLSFYANISENLSTTQSMNLNSILSCDLIYNEGVSSSVETIVLILFSSLYKTYCDKLKKESVYCAGQINFKIFFQRKQ